jgi:hypothetical protein
MFARCSVRRPPFPPQGRIVSSLLPFLVEAPAALDLEVGAAQLFCLELSFYLYFFFFCSHTFLLLCFF